MESKSRTEYSAKNTTVSLISRLLSILMGYALRVIFTHTLSASYVGINGLFQDIINVLSLSELGVGTAITYALYKPIADGDTEKQKSLMQMFGRFYHMVALVTGLAGTALVPFLPWIIKDSHSIDCLAFLYLLYLSNTVSSYLLSYKRVLIDAHQLLYIGTLYQTIFWVVKDLIQMVVLILLQNFVLFLVIDLVTTVICNICISRKANRLYPYLRDPEILPLPKEEKTAIFKNIRAMMMHKIGNVVVNNTDNLLLSAFTGITVVGSYSNYYLVIGSLRQLATQIFQGLAASIGNLGATESKQKIRTVFEATFFIGQWIYGLCVITLYELVNPFIVMSFGRQYLFDEKIVLVLCINFFLNGMRNAALTFRDSLGLFWYDRYKAVPEAIINLAVSLILVSQFGAIGVFGGTMISTLATSFWIEPLVLYKYGFHASGKDYFVRYGVYSAVIGVVWFVTDRLCGQIQGSLPVLLCIRFLICMLVTNSCFFLFYHQTAEFLFLRKKAWKLLHRKLQKKDER